jgi:ubiquinone/menaquinone biosynthesis C-methylase UbiE
MVHTVNEVAACILRLLTGVRDVATVIQYRVGFFPHPYQLYSAMKIYELEVVLAHLDQTPQATLVDLCCGTGIQTQLLARGARRIVGIDIDVLKIRDATWHLRHSRAGSNVAFVVGRAEGLPLPDMCADAVVSLCAIEHIVDPVKALTEVVRTMKPGSQLCITADSLANVADTALRAQHSLMYDVKNYFDVESITALLQHAGLVVELAHSILRSPEAVDELRRCMERPRRDGALRTYRLLTCFRRRDAEAEPGAAGLFVFAAARKPFVRERAR